LREVDGAKEGIKLVEDVVEGPEISTVKLTVSLKKQIIDMNAYKLQ
jgi:hypothetical protein